MARLVVPSLRATPQSAASAPSTAAEFRAAGDASADASSAAFESSSDVSKTVNVPRRLYSNCTARRVCAPVLVVGLIGAIFAATVMMAATSSSPAEARGLSTARGDDGPVTAQRDGFVSTELMKGCVRLPRPARGRGVGANQVTHTLSSLCQTLTRTRTRQRARRARAGPSSTRPPRSPSTT